MSILQRIFGNTPVPAGPPQQPGLMGMQEPVMMQNSNGHAPNPNLETQPNPQLQQTEPKKDESPMGEWADLWQIDPKQQAPQDITEFSFNVDRKKVADQVGQIDFTKSLTPELMQKISAGGPEAMSAVLSAMNVMAQQAMLQATLAGSSITEAGLRSSNTRIASELPGMLRKQSISNALREDNPLFSNPAVAPMLEAVQEQFTRKFPNATQAQILENSKKYLVGFAAEIGKINGTDANAPSNGQPVRAAVQDDWSNEPI